jgi:hypothetical protein
VSAWEYGYLYQIDQSLCMILDSAGAHTFKVNGDISALNAAGAQGWIIYEDSDTSYSISNNHWLWKIFQDNGMTPPVNCSYRYLFMRRELQNR